MPSRIAIMQGRLGPPEAGRFQSFPRERWRQEFNCASEAKIDAIEWIYDQYGRDINPLASAEGIAGMKRLSAESGVEIVSLCADYFMERPLVRVSDAELSRLLRRLNWLLDRSKLAGIERIVLPFVDNSRIGNEEDVARVVEVLGFVLPKAEANRIELHLETSLGPAAFAALLDRLPSPWLKANYDSGNSASLGYDPVEEFAAYGGRIGSVHVKDRVLGGGTVPLGEGDANLVAVFQEIARVEYAGDFVLQVARGEPGQEVAWAKHNREYTLALLDRSVSRSECVA